MFLVFHTGEDVLTAIHTFAVVPGQVLREEQRAQLGKPHCGGHGGGVAVPGTELLTSSTSCPGTLGASSGTAGSTLSRCSGACVCHGARPAGISLGRTGAAVEAPRCTRSHHGLPKCCYGFPLHPPSRGMGGQGWNSHNVAVPHVPAPQREQP